MCGEKISSKDSLNYSLVNVYHYYNIKIKKKLFETVIVLVICPIFCVKKQVSAINALIKEYELITLKHMVK